MLSFVRKAARSWVAAVLIGLLVVSFAIWGINDVFKGTSKDNVAIVDGKAISSAEFRNEFDQVLKRAGRESGKAISIKEARDQGGDISTLERMVTERSFNAFFEKTGIRVAADIVQKEIKKIASFQDPMTKSFSQDAYNRLLNDNGLTPKMFEDNIRTEMGKRLVILAGTSGFRAPKAFASQTLAYGTERRLITLLPVAANLAGQPVTPTDAQINTFYEEVKGRLMRPEVRDFTIVVADGEKFAAKAAVNPAQVKQIFDAQKDKLATPAKRSFVQIIAPDQAKADEATKRLQSGEKAEAIAKALGLQAPLTFTDAAQSAVPDAEVAKAVFAAKTGAIGAVKGALSYSAYQITSEKAEIPADFNKIAPDITKQLQREIGGQALSDAAEAFDDAIAQGDSLEVAAKKAGFEIVRVTNLNAKAVDATGKSFNLIASNEAALAQSFNLAQGDSTELLAAPNDSYIAVRADKIVPSSPVPLAEIKKDLVVEWQKRDIAIRLKAKAEEILKDAKSIGFEAAAKKYNLTIVKPPKPLLRGQGGQELSGAIFGAKKGEIVMGTVANGVEIAIARIDGILRDDDAKAQSRLIEAEQSIRSSVQQDIAQAIDAAAKRRAKAKTFPQRMKTIFGDIETNEAQKPAK